ncbi:glycoside hydrolase family 125 protein [Aquisphaera insulae]|uniref:glycoside hydrolase family 125 protein n=1 Tax=Aquisphaera insulae TaxID=2712864 RepID=UPI0013E9DF70|nr:glycoside hydrolase family 125 protein [Aquisphaera insulae]
MRNRRSFLRWTAAAAPFSRAFLAPAVAGQAEALQSRRPPASARKFTSEAVEAKIAEVKKAIADPELAWLFENCFPNTLDTTVRTGKKDGKADTFVITGDIDAMWLRDSTAQVWPYLPLAKDDPALKTFLAGVINRQARCINIDPYANAFNEGPTGSHWEKDHTKMRPDLHERKWEIDSLCYPIRLAHGYWKTTGDASLFDADWRKAMSTVVRTFREQQRLKDRGPYTFQRDTANPTDSLPNRGYGNPTRPCGLIHSGFRPSDDACIFPFLIPSNLFAVTSLEHLREIYEAELADKSFANECHEFAEQVREAVRAHGLVAREGGDVYAYEVDGYGSRVFMDDANVPSLISLPYLGCVAVDDPTYLRTRAWVLSDDNPYYFRGKAAEGLGGPHSGMDMIWPLGIITRALTSRDESEVARCLSTLKQTHAGTGFMHESFHKDDAKNFTRSWFAWANTLFGELILTIHDRYPKLLRG